MDSPHGHANLHWEDNLLVDMVYGPFNRQGYELAVQNLFAELARADKALFSMMSVWDEDALSSPDVMNELAGFWQQLEQCGCRRYALVVPTTMQQLIVETMLPPFAKIFRDQQQARDWLAQEK